MKKFIIVTLFVFSLQFVIGQVKSPDQRVLDQSCDCINKISIFSTLEAKHDSIHKCITMANVNVQVMDDLTGKLKKVAAGESKDSVSVVIADKDFQLFQEKLLRDCPYLKKLLMYDSNEFEHSVSKNKAAVDFYKKGVQYSEHEQYDLALVEYNKAVKKDPKFAFAWDNMGICYRKLKRYKEAINCYKKSLELDPKGNNPLMNMGVAYELLQDYKSAAEVYTKYIEYYPEDPEGFYGAARMYYLDKNYPKGLDYIFQAYVIYKKTGSPYIHDAEATIRGFYGDMKEQNQLDEFKKIAEKYNIKIN
jgi:tetratricopeptide (TPR) repeat protein